MPTSMAGAVGRGRGDRGTGGEGCNDRTLCGAVASMAYSGVIWISIRIKLGGFGSGVQSCAGGRDRHAHVGMAGAEEKECRRKIHFISNEWLYLDSHKKIKMDLRG